MSQQFYSPLQLNSTLTVGADDTGNDVIFYGATSGRYLQWDESQDRLELRDNVQIAWGSGIDFTIVHDGTDSTITNSTGDLYIRNYADDKDIIFQSDDGSGGVAEYLSLDGSDVNIKVRQHMVFNDGKAAYFGGGADLHIQHDGTNSSISNNTGNLSITQNTDDGAIRFNADDGSGGVAEYFRIDGADELNKFFKGVDITGELQATSLDINGAAAIDGDLTLANSNRIVVSGSMTTAGNFDAAKIRLNSTNVVNTTGFQGIRFSTSSSDNYGWSFGANRSSSGRGSLRFYEHNGANAGTERFTLLQDGNVGIGTASPTSPLTIKSNSTSSADSGLTIQSTGNTNAILKIAEKSTDGGRFHMYDGGVEKIAFYTDGTANHISAGNFGIGTASPSTVLHATGAGVNFIATVENTGTGTGKSGLWVKTDSTWTNALILKLTAGTSDTSIMEVNAATVRIGGGTITQNDQALHLPDSKKIGLGDSSDLNLYHDASHSYIVNNTGNLQITNNTDNGDILFKSDNGSGGVTTYFYLDGSYVDGSGTLGATRFADKSKIMMGTGGDLHIYHDGTDSIIQNYTGDLTIKNTADDKDIIFQSDDGSGGVTTYLTIAGADGHTVANKEINFLDNVKGTFGHGSDLQIYHDGSNSYINDAGTGDLLLRRGLAGGLNITGTGVLVNGNLITGTTEITKTTSTSGTTGTTFLELDNNVGGDISQQQTFIDFKFTDTNANHTPQVRIGAQVGPDADANAISKEGAGSFVVYTAPIGSDESGGSTGLAEAFRVSYDKSATFAGDLTVGADDTGHDVKFFGATSGRYMLWDQSYDGLILSDNTKLQLGSSTGYGDLQLLHDGTNSYIQNGFGDLYINQNVDDGDIIFQSDDGSGGLTTYLTLDGGFSVPYVALEDSAILALGTSKDLLLTHDGTDSKIDNMNTGDLKIRNFADDKDIILMSDNGSGGVTAYITLDGSHTKTIMGKTVHFDDNVKIQMGNYASPDLEIFHDGTHSYVSDTGTGNLNLKGQNLNLLASNSHDMLRCVQGGEVEIYHNNVKKFETTSGGVNVTGNIAANSVLLFDSSSNDRNVLDLDASDNLQVATGTSSGTRGITFLTEGLERMRVTHGGNVGIGTTSPSAGSMLEVIGKGDQLGSTGFYVNSSFKDDNNVGVFICHDDTVNNTGAIAGINQLSFVTYGGSSPAWGERMKITGAGDVGIGTTSPSQKLHVDGKIRANSWFQGADGTNTLWASTSEGILIETPGSTSNNNDSKIYFRNSGNTVKHTFDTNNGNATFTGDLGVAGNIYQTESGTTSGIGVFMPMVKGGLKVTSSQGTTGRLRIKVPTYKSNTMQTFYVDVYEYDTDRSATYRVSGYNYSDTNATWYNTTVVTLLDSDNRDLTVRFGADTSASEQYVAIGEVNTTWNYVQVVVRDYMGGYNTSVSEATAAFEIEFVTTDNATYNVNHDNNQPYANWSKIENIPANVTNALPTTGGTMTGNITTTGGDSVAPQINILHDGTNPGVNEELGVIQFQVDYDGSHQDWGKIRLDTNASAVRTNMEFYVKSASGAEQVALTLQGQASAVPNATFAGDVNLADSKYIKLGTGGDFEMHHNGVDTIVGNQTGDLKIRQFANDKDIIFDCDDGSGGVTTYLTLDGSATTTVFSKQTRHEDSVLLQVGSSNDAAFYHNGTDTYLINDTGNLRFRQFADDADIMFESDDGSGGITEYFRVDGSSQAIIISKATQHGDNVRAYYGAGNDLEIWHDGTDSVIQNDTGDLEFQNRQDDGDIKFKSDDGSGGVAEYFRLDGGGELTYFSKAIQMVDNAKIFAGSAGDLQIYHDGTYNVIKAVSGHMLIKQDSNDQDIILQSDDGAGGTTTYFSLDGSAAAHDGSATTSLTTNWPDNSKITLGASNDLQLLHNATNSYIQNYVGDLYINNWADNKDIIFQSDDGSGGVETYFYLDGSASSGNPYTVFPDNSLLSFGTSNDMIVSHNATNSLIQNNTGDLYIMNQADDKDIIFQADDGSGGNTTYLTIAGADGHTVANKEINFLDNVKATFGHSSDLQLYHNGTTSNNNIENHTGDLYVTQYVDNGGIIFRSDNSTGGVTEYFRVDGENSRVKFSVDTLHLDNKKALFGNSLDLQIYHDGSNSYIKDLGVGDLRVMAGNAIQFYDAGTAETLAKFNSNGSVDLYHNNVKKFETAAAGVKTSYAATSSTDGDAAGDIVNLGETTTVAGKIYYYTSSGAWELADADAESTAKGMLGVALGTSSNTHGMLIRGMVTLDHDPGTIADTLFLSTTAGAATATAPSGTGDIVRVIGYCLNSTNGQIYFNPDGAFVEVTAG